MPFPPRIKTDAEMGRKDRRLAMVDVDIDICAECGEHADWEETDDGCVSSCCGAGPIETDPDLDLER